MVDPEVRQASIELIFFHREVDPKAHHPRRRAGTEIDLEADGPDLAVGETDMRADLLSALLNLGYHRPLAERAVSAALKAGDGTFQQTLRQALKELAR